MDFPSIASIFSIVVTAIVGIILSKQIKSQSEIIQKYKDLVNAYNPDKIIVLHEREVAKLKESMSLDTAELKNQIIELGAFATKSLEVFEEQHKSIGRTFYRTEIVKNNMPHCIVILSEINRYSDS